MWLCLIRWFKYNSNLETFRQTLLAMLTFQALLTLLTLYLPCNAGRRVYFSRGCLVSSLSIELHSPILSSFLLF